MTSWEVLFSLLKIIPGLVVLIDVSNIFLKTSQRGISVESWTCLNSTPSLEWSTCKSQAPAQGTLGNGTLEVSLIQQALGFFVYWPFLGVIK